MELVLILVLLHNKRVLVISWYCLVELSKVTMKKRGYTDYWLFSRVEFQTDVSDLVTERERGIG